MKMSKMKMPEMSVVRFNESDVIVASRGFYTVHNATDLTGYNLSITNPAGTYIYKTNRSGHGINDMAPYDGNSAMFYYSETTNSYNLNQLIDNDSREPGLPSIGADGDYNWDVNDSSFKKQ